MKLILQTHWQPMQRSNWAFFCGKILIEVFRILDSYVEEGLMQAIRLFLCQSFCVCILIRLPSRLYYQLMSKTCPVAESSGNFFGRPLPG